MIAVKKLSLRIEDISNKKFLDEVDVLRRLNHKNIVRFLGYCADTHGEVMDVEGKLRVVEEPQRLLCFEYAPNGNLHDYIRGIEFATLFDPSKMMSSAIISPDRV